MLDWPAGIYEPTIEISIKAVRETLARAEVLARGDPSSAERSSALSSAIASAAPLQEFTQALADRQTAIANAIALAAEVIRQAGIIDAPDRFTRVFDGFYRYIHDLDRVFFAGQVDTIRSPPKESYRGPESFPITSDKGKAQQWSEPYSADNLKQRNSLSPPDLKDQAEAAWTGWHDPILAFVHFPDGLPLEPPRFNDLVLVAAGRLPSRLLRNDLGKVNAFEWTELALAAIACQRPAPGRTDPPEYAPAWAAIAALHRLGFSREALVKVLDALSIGEEQVGAHDHFLPNSGIFEPGILMVAAPEMEHRPSMPYILLGPAALDAYATELKWLVSIGVIEAGTYQRE